METSIRPNINVQASAISAFVVAQSGPSFGDAERVNLSRPSPPVTTKLKIYPSNTLQNPPYCTNLQL